MRKLILAVRCWGSARRSLRSGRCWIPMLALAAAACPAATPPPASQPQRTPGSRESVQPFRVIAHRGASAYAPENTRPAFQRALELGVRHVELDIGDANRSAVRHPESLRPGLWSTAGSFRHGVTVPLLQR